MEDTYAGAVATVRRLAAAAFAAHVLTELGPGEWRAAKPDTGMYSFRVLIRPGTVVLWGDIGDGIFRGGGGGGDGDTLAWLRKAVHSPDYLLEKLRHSPEHWYAGDALAHAREGAAEGSRLWETVLTNIARWHPTTCLDAHTWSCLVGDCGGDGEMMRIGWGHAAGALWLVEGLRWFVEALPQGGEAK